MDVSDRWLIASLSTISSNYTRTIFLFFHRTHYLYLSPAIILLDIKE
jgi:hypothetical protein